MNEYECNIDWMTDGYDISVDDMYHELFEKYETNKENKDYLAYELKIDNVIFLTRKEGCG